MERKLLSILVNLIVYLKTQNKVAGALEGEVLLKFLSWILPPLQLTLELAVFSTNQKLILANFNVT